MCVFKLWKKGIDAVWNQRPEMVTALLHGAVLLDLVRAITTPAVKFLLEKVRMVPPTQLLPISVWALSLLPMWWRLWEDLALQPWTCSGLTELPHSAALSPCVSVSTNTLVCEVRLFLMDVIWWSVSPRKRPTHFKIGHLCMMACFSENYRLLCVHKH